MPENPCGEGNPPPIWRWLQGNEPLTGQDRRYYVIGTAEISTANQNLRGEYRCPTDPDWNPQIVDALYQPLPPGREVHRLWAVEMSYFGIGGTGAGWYSVDFSLRVETLYNYFIDQIPVTRDEIFLVDVDGNKSLLSTGNNARVWVVKSRYRDNGGPWQELADFSELL
jgi:hypothetical protein